MLEQTDYLIIAGIAFAVLWIYENKIKKKTYPPTFNDIESLEKKMTTKLDSIKNYDDTNIKKSVLTLNKNMMFFNNRLKQFQTVQPTIDNIKLDIEALKTRIPELRQVVRTKGIVEITPELREAIRGFKYEKGMSYREIMRELGIKKWIVEKCLKEKDIKMKPEEHETYIG